MLGLNVCPWRAELFWGQKYIYISFIILSYVETEMAPAVETFNSWNARTNLTSIINTADDLAKQGAKWLIQYKDAILPV